MPKIDTSSWGEFVVGKLFNIKPTKAYKLTNAELLDGGENPVVVNSAYNNGIGGTSSKDTTEKGNMITFSDTVDANTIFYQENPFIGYSHVQGLYPIGQYATCWSKERLMFFATSFRKSALVKGFDYGNKFRRDIASTLKVKLPIDSKGDPDWLYMENYMRNIEVRVSDSISKLESAQRVENSKIDLSSWGEFPLIELFDFYLSKGDNQAQKLDEGEIPLVSSGSFNNGICKYIDKGDGISELYDYGLITIDMFGQSFYQNKPFYAVSHGRVNILKPKFEINEQIGLFIASVMQKMYYEKYGYATMCSQTKLKKECIKLPINSEGNPDWLYMENYMKALETKVSDFLDKTT